ncbi:MAG: glycosyltransferase family 4 protein [Acidobacteriota bacterium]|nr:glycosyltransferase family 4 protein [Acidobacteriota bacterium]MDQ2840934.1 glycosyltransferase family 4 protein [Acidobacteriota bacterium]
MRILHLDMGKEMRGGQHQVIMLLKGLREAGHTSMLFARRDSPLWRAAEAAGFCVGPGGLNRLWKESRAVDIVHAHDAHSHTLAAVASRRGVVVSRRVAFPVKRNLLSRWKYGRPKRFVAVSNFVAHRLEIAGVPTEKIDVVYDGVDVGGPLRRETPQPPLVVALASQEPQKGRDLVERASMLTNVRIVFSQDLASDLKRASLFLYITRSEGLGSAALLAMSYGVPVIASCVGGLPEIITDSQSGLLVRNDPQEIASAISKIVSDPPLAESLARGGRSKVERNFSATRMVESTIESYKKALRRA